MKLLSDLQKEDSLQSSQLQTTESQEPLLISPSRISTYVECPKKYDYIYNQKLQSTGPSKSYFDKGNYFHELAHVYYQLIESGVVPGSDYAVANITSRIRKDVSKAQRELLPVYGIISKTIIRYIKEQSPKIDRGMKVVATESELLLPVSSQYTLFGYADLIYKNTKFRVRDHKTGERALTKLDAQFSNQLLFYATLLYYLKKEIPIAEINWINTAERAKPIPYDKAFIFSEVVYSQKELEIYFEQICKVIEKMLQSEPIPHYGNHCSYCPFKNPCFLSRKGIDPTPIINTHFTRRESSRTHVKFTEAKSVDSTENDSD